MEETDQSRAIALKNTWIYQFLAGIPYLRKIVSTVMYIFLPWAVVKRLNNKLANIQTENLKLVDSVYYVKSGSIKHFLESQGPTGRVSFDQIAGMLHWPELLVDDERTNGLGELLRLKALHYDEVDTVSHPSCCWVLLAVKNYDQLLRYGYDNFKRTIGHNYFNFLVKNGDSQIKAVESLLSDSVRESCFKAAIVTPHDPSFNSDEQATYHYFTFMLWEYVKQIDRSHYLDILDEPQEGNPLIVSKNGKNMSQDLANSLIEYYSIDQVVPFKKFNTILEIGGGYGRNAHVILSLNPKARIVMIDIMPALYIAQRYLSSVFKGKKIFKAKKFSNYAEVKDEIESSSIVFLLPSQIELLPKNYTDLTINISSFGEMNKDQIQWYFQQINRITKSYFYMKQWNVSQNPFDGLVLKKSDYPYLENWDEVYSRNCAVQTEFFETLFQVK